MKLNKWMFGVLATALFAACSDKDTPTSPIEEGGTGDGSYLGISLELPSEPISRTNDVFDDGLNEEYNVINAAVLLFKGANENDAQFIGAYRLGVDEAFDQPDGDNITVSFQKSIRLLDKPTFKNNEKLWGLALVNYSTNVFTLGTTQADYGSLSIKTTKEDEKTDVDFKLTRISDAEADDSTTPPAPTTFAALRTKITSSNFIRTTSGKLNGIFMTNAPLSNTKGSTATLIGDNFKIQTLAELKSDAFEKNQEDAVKNPAGCIFVERAVAKITCSNFPSSAKVNRTLVTLNSDGVPEYTNSEVEIQVEKVEWALDNEEKTSYFIRNAQTNQSFWKYQNSTKKISRFIGGAGMNDYFYDSNSIHEPNATATWYRTYWCVDPYYDKDKKFNNQVTNENGQVNFIDLTKSGNLYESPSALYPHENTFDVKHQNYKNTTRVIFKVKYGYNNGAQLYVVRDQSSAFYLEEDAQNLIKRSVMGSTKLHDLIKKYLKPNTTLDYSVKDFNFDFGLATNDDIDSVYDGGIEVGDYILKNLTFRSDFFNKTDFIDNIDDKYIAEVLAEVAIDASTANAIVPLKDNTCYYTAYIQHFGDTYCNLPEDWKGDKTSIVYDKDNEVDYLGRYGMVRNNWYDLNIQPILKLGSPNIPDGNVDKSDDNKLEEWYLAARVHILSWAKRTQKVEF